MVHIPFRTPTRPKPWPHSSDEYILLVLTDNAGPAGHLLTFGPPINAVACQVHQPSVSFGFTGADPDITVRIRRFCISDNLSLDGVIPTTPHNCWIDLGLQRIRLYVDVLDVTAIHSGGVADPHVIGSLRGTITRQDLPAFLRHTGIQAT